MVNSKEKTKSELAKVLSDFVNQRYKNKTGSNQ